MQITSYHAKYFAFELTRRSSSYSLQKLATCLLDAQVDLNPHQVEAALFAFHSPLSKGAILADEVGLGKTIEAGLVISQKWAERKRKILNLEEKVTAHRQIKEMEKKRNTLRLNLYQSQDEVDNKKEQLIEEIESRLKQKTETTELFTVRWKVI